MRSQAPSEAETRLIHAAVAKMRAGIMAIVFGMFAGTGLFVATVWLLILGGPNPGPTLGLLSNYFPGYSVTWHGSVVGFLYAAAVGAVAGWTMASLYNWLSERRRQR